MNAGGRYSEVPKRQVITETVKEQDYGAGSIAESQPRCEQDVEDIKRKNENQAKGHNECHSDPKLSHPFLPLRSKPLLTFDGTSTGVRRFIRCRHRRLVAAETLLRYQPRPQMEQDYHRASCQVADASTAEFALEFYAFEHGLNF